MSGWSRIPMRWRSFENLEARHLLSVGEVGILTASQGSRTEWHAAEFSHDYVNPIVVLGPVTQSDPQPATTRIRNVTNSGFEWQVDEWDYLDGIHGPESVGYFVLEEGTHTIDGTKLIAGNASANHLYSTVNFDAFNSTPVVLATVSSVVGGSAVTTRIKDVAVDGFKVALLEEEGNDGSHAVETVSYIAVDMATGSLANLDFVSDTTGPHVNHLSHNIDFAAPFANAPAFLANVQTVFGGDPTGLRISHVNASGSSIFLEEEQSANSEIGHAQETVSYLAIEPGLIGGTATNHSPPMISDQSFSISVNALNGDTAGTVTAADPDAWDTVTYSFAQANSIFAIDSDTGQITVADQQQLTVGSLDVDVVVTDSQGLIDSATATINVVSGSFGTIGEAGTLSANGTQWNHVDFQHSYQDPIVVMGPLANNDSDPANVRIRNVTPSGFEWRIQEWNYQDGLHAAETASYLVMESGHHVFLDGTEVIAGSVVTNHQFAHESLDLPSTPVVLATVASVNGGSAVIPRMDSVSAAGFDVKLSEEQGGDYRHALETINYVAIQQATSETADQAYTSEVVSNVNHTNYQQALIPTFDATPAFFGNIQTNHGGDVASLRLNSVSTAAAVFFLEEEQSFDAEVNHGMESVGYLAVEVGTILGKPHAEASPIYGYDHPLPLAPPDPADTITVTNVSELISAVSNLQTGNTISLAPGIYDLSGSVEALYVPQGITDWAIRGATGNRDDIVIRGAGMTGGVRFGVWVRNSPRGTVADLTIDGVKDHGIQLNIGAHDMLVHNVRIIDSGDQFVKSTFNSGNGNNRGTVQYSVFEYRTTDSDDYTNGVDVHDGDDWIIRYNLFQNILSPVGEALAGPSILMWNGSRNTVVEGNTFINSARGIALGLLDKSGRFDHEGGIIRNNFFYRDPNLPHAVDVAIMVADSPGTKVYHNTLINRGSYPNAIEYRFASSTDIDIRNNLTDAGIQARNGALGTVQGNVTDASLAMFVDPTVGNLHLRSDASVIDQALSLSDVLTDIDGLARDSNPDVGADELAG